MPSESFKERLTLLRKKRRNLFKKERAPEITQHDVVQPAEDEVSIQVDELAHPEPQPAVPFDKPEVKARLIPDPPSEIIEVVVPTVSETTPLLIDTAPRPHSPHSRSETSEDSMKQIGFQVLAALLGICALLLIIIVIKQF